VRRYRWTILALGATAQGSYAAIFLCLPVLAPALRAEYGLSLTQIGVALAAPNLGSVATLLAWGLTADRIGERVVLAAGLLVASAALVAAAFTESFGLLVGILAVAGAAGASVNAASGRAVMGWFAPGERGFALALRQTSNPLGGLLAAVLLPPIAAAGGVRAGLLALAGFCAAAALAGVLGLRDAPAGPDVAPHVGHPLRDERIWRVSAGSGLLVVAQMSVLSFTVLFLHGERGLSIAAAGGVLAGIQAAGALLRIAAGRWSDRVGARIAPLLRLCFAFAVALALTAALTSAPLALLVPTLLVAGALSQSWNGLSFTATAELAGRARSGAALGFQQTSLAVAAAAATPLFAATVEASSWGIAFGLAALLPLAGAGLVRRIAV
jgi:sugar phosphate permease